MRFIIGKLYMENCPHCTPLVPIWESLKERMNSKNQDEKLGLDIVYIDEESENIDSKLEKYNQQYFNGEKKIQVQVGYPTIFFAIPEKKVDYYEGERSLDALESWCIDKMGLQKKINYIPSSAVKTSPPKKIPIKSFPLFSSMNQPGPLTEKKHRRRTRRRRKTLRSSKKTKTLSSRTSFRSRKNSKGSRSTL